ncbi:MAG TPA: hypothetical protein VJW76_02880 [Verrucomicrobiae bacterium]|nr:hypothetical protein [Verrucomicrobiae bacterium]
MTRPDHGLASKVIAAQRKRTDLEVKEVRLTTPEPDYGRLLEELFEADSIEVW